MLKGFTPIVLGLTLLASPAFAAKAARHCVSSDNKEIAVTKVAGSTRSAQCTAAGGKWVKVKASSNKPTTSSTPATPAPATPAPQSK
jgi:hypothetical protein